MAKEVVIAEKDEEVKELVQKIKELKKNNLRLQQHFSKISKKNKEPECSSPFGGNHSFNCSFSFTIDLQLQKLVWLNDKSSILNFRDEKLFLQDVNKLTFRLIAQADRKRFKEIISKYLNGACESMQTLLRVNHSENITWVLACFEKVTYSFQNEEYLQVQFIKLDENKELSNLYSEFNKKVENGAQYQKVEMLTFRQREILCLLGKGFTSKEIADLLKISFHTVEAHRKKISKVTQIRKRAELICLAVEVGIIN